jgi:ribonuclease P protein component
MLPKTNRVTKKDVDLLFKQSKFITSPVFTFKYLLTNNKQTKISFIAPKSVAKMAVKRNLLRRRGYNVLGKYIGQFPSGLVGVFIFKKYEEDISTIEQEIKNIFDKVN